MIAHALSPDKRPNADYLYQLSMAHDVEGFDPVKLPEGFNYYPYQKVGIYYGLLVKHVFIADEMGLGKTLEAIGILNELFKNKKIKVLIVCPRVMRPIWLEELNRFLARKDLKIQVLTKLKDEPHNSSDIVICSYAYLASPLRATQIFEALNKKFVLIGDEVHLLKSGKNAKRAVSFLGKFGAHYWSEKTILLSGTPATSRPMEFYPMIKGIAPETIDNMDQRRFGYKYCAGFVQEIRNKRVENFRGASNMKELGARLRKGFMVRREQAKVDAQLPALSKRVVHLDFENETLSMQKKILKIQEYKQDLALGHVESIPFEEISSVRHEIGLMKAETSADYIRTQLESGAKKILVFYHHKSVRDILKENLKDYGICEFYGGQSDSSTLLNKERFMRDESFRVALLSITAAGVGLTLTSANYCIFSEFSWVPGENEQAYKRAHRTGQVNRVLVDFLVCPNSIDERMLEVVLKKEKHLKELYGV